MRSPLLTLIHILGQNGGRRSRMWLSIRPITSPQARPGQGVEKHSQASASSQSLQGDPKQGEECQLRPDVLLPVGQTRKKVGLGLIRSRGRKRQKCHCQDLICEKDEEGKKRKKSAPVSSKECLRVPGHQISVPD